MPTHPGAAQQRRGGLVPRPAGSAQPAALVGRTDWAPSVRTPPRLCSRQASRAPRRKRRVIGWAAIGAFAFGVSGVVIAVQRGQDVCEVSATGIKFCEHDDDARREVAQAQPAIEERASQCESEAQAQGTGAVAAETADITGTWLGDNGFTYVIQQFGNQARSARSASAG